LAASGVREICARPFNAKDAENASMTETGVEKAEKNALDRELSR
jgi:hypothetical protein